MEEEAQQITKSPGQLIEARSSGPIAAQEPNYKKQQARMLLRWLQMG